MSKDFIQVALIQAKYQGSKEAMNRHIVKKIKEASEAGSDLVVLQELHQSEYFCQSEDTKYFEYAKNFKEDVEFWAKISEENNIVLVSSLFEQRTPGLYHNTAVVFDKGVVAGKYRKMHIPDDPGFYEKFYFTVGDIGFEPIDTSLGRLGVLVCWDQWYPEAARIMALKGAQILIYPTAIGWFDSDTQVEKNRQKESWITIQRSHAIANAIPLLSCNRVGFEEDSSGVLDGIRFWGSSFICGAQGEIIAKASSSEEEILYATLDMERTKEVRDIWPFFRDRRIDSYDDILKRFCD
jgi:N-carbamoylputrescine amidase